MATWSASRARRAPRPSGPTTSVRFSAVILLLALTLAGCGESFEKPTTVHVSRVLTTAGDRIVTYTAMYDDGIETYIDFEPQGDVDMITVERDAVGELTHYVREGFETRAVEADIGEHAALTPEWQKRFEQVDSLVNVELVPWSDAHGLMTPREFDRLREQGGP